MATASKILRQVSSLCRSSSKSSTVRENQHRCTVFSSTVSQAIISSAHTPSLKSVPFFVEEFHRTRKPAPLHRFLVHSQSSDDKQRPYAKFQVCAILPRRVPPCAEISTAAPFSRPCREMISSARTPSLKSVPFLVEEFHRARKPVPQRFLVHGYVVSGVIVEAPYKRDMPSQCHRCQLYGHAAVNCFAQPRCVKCLVPHWTKDCERTKESGGKLSYCNCGQEHTANYGGCSVAPKPKPLKFKSINMRNLPVIKNLNGSQFPPLDQNQTTQQPGRIVKIHHKQPAGEFLVQPPQPPSSQPAPASRPLLLLTNGRSRFHRLRSDLYTRLTLGSLQVKRRVIPGPRRPSWGRTLIL
ncbi:Nucleic-acid-binding protein from transposon X-element [Eumeta japonica]|uniref:Nucleic-acid-binding protein from transposon X-element n=1 Tax=Eumeta variegata TaxID=151549 RepID=A0A4C1T3M7_EUMVA|nr:Nucleic-acid-binding protein from transposon X-element [Eumeta japonica]